jgi:hypothetical protein
MNPEPSRSATISPFDRRSLAGWSVVLLLGALAWRTLRYALVFPMWGDEGMLAVNFFERDWAGLTKTLDYGQVAPPGFLWLELAASRLAGFSEPALRLVPYLAGIAAVLLFWRVCRELLDRRSAVMALAVFAASFYPARYAAEVKPYSLDLLAALAILAIAWSVYLRPASATRWIAFAALSAASVWLSYPSVFVATGACGFLLLYPPTGQESRRIGAVALVSILLAASFVAMYALVGSGQRAAAPASYWSAGFPPMSEPWLLPLWALDVHTGMMLAYPNGGHSGGSAVSFLLAVVGAVLLWRNRRPALALLLSPLPLMFLAAALQQYPYGASARVAQHVAPAACMLIGTGVVCTLRKVMGPRRAIRALPFAVLPFLAVVVGGLVRDVAYPYHSLADGMAREAIAELSRETAEGDRWAVFASRERGREVPYFSRFVGMGGRIHFQILSQAPVAVQWGPNPEEIAESDESLTWLIAYGNRVYEPAREELDAYLHRLTPAVETAPLVRRHELPDGEWIEIYAIGGP